jgi:hypothetical protein
MLICYGKTLCAFYQGPEFLPRVLETGGMGKLVVKSCLPTPIVGRRSDGMDYCWDLVLFRLVSHPLQPGMVVSFSWYGLYGSPAVCH